MIHEELDVNDETFDEPGAFASLAEALVAEHSRLAALAERCRIDGEGIAAREAAAAEREHALEERRRELQQEADGLSRWRDELHERLQVVERGEARLAEAQEREARLAALGSELLARYGPGSPAQD